MRGNFYLPCKVPATCIISNETNKLTQMYAKCSNMIYVNDSIENKRDYLIFTIPSKMCHCCSVI